MKACNGAMRRRPVFCSGGGRSPGFRKPFDDGLVSESAAAFTADHLSVRDIVSAGHMGDDYRGLFTVEKPFIAPNQQSQRVDV